MSECVVRMEMPKHCYHCDLRYECDAFYAPGKRKPFDKGCRIVCQLPEGHGRLVDADAYSVEMKDRQEAAWKWRNEAIAEEDEVKLARAEGAYTAFTEAKLTMDKHIINPWHRVEEPPKGHGPYLCATKSKLQDGQTYWFFTLCWYADGDLKDVVWDAEKESGFYNWSASQDREIDSRVDYWMPIEPPKEDA